LVGCAKLNLTTNQFAVKEFPLSKHDKLPYQKIYTHGGGLSRNTTGGAMDHLLRQPAH